MALDVSNPIKLSLVKRLVATILTSGEVIFIPHAEEELANDKLATGDALNALRSGVYREPEWVKGAWRYKAEGRGMVVVFEVDSETCCIVVTCWKLK